MLILLLNNNNKKKTENITTEEKKSLFKLQMDFLYKLYIIISFIFIKYFIDAP